MWCVQGSSLMQKPELMGENAHHLQTNIPYVGARFSYCLIPDRQRKVLCEC